MNEVSHIFAAHLQQGTVRENIDILFLSSTEAEALKRSANRYDSCLNDVEEKVYAQDIFQRD